MAEALQQGEIDALSADADRFLAELDEESYLHFAGLKETFEIAPIYERHERLTQLDTALGLGASVDGNRRRRELWKFACAGDSSATQNSAPSTESCATTSPLSFWIRKRSTAPNARL